MICKRCGGFIASREIFSELDNPCWETVNYCVMCGWQELPPVLNYQVEEKRGRYKRKHFTIKTP